MGETQQSTGVTRTGGELVRRVAHHPWEGVRVARPTFLAVQICPKGEEMLDDGDRTQARGAHQRGQTVPVQLVHPGPLLKELQDLVRVLQMLMEGRNW